MSELQAEKFENINSLRALAALAVLLFHVVLLTQSAAPAVEAPLAIFRFGWLGVHLFFSISGFVIAYTTLILYRNEPGNFARSYWHRRITRIVPLYLLTIVVWIALFRRDFFIHADWVWQLFTHLTFTHSFWPETHGAIDGANWSLAIEMHFYLVIAILIGWIDRTPGWRIWLYCILISWAWRTCMVVLYGHTDVTRLFVYVDQLPGVLDEFGAGIFLAKQLLAKRQRSSGRGMWWLFLACLAGYLSMKIMLWAGPSYWDIPWMVVFWHSAFAVFLVCALAAAINLPQFADHRWLSPINYLGQISYGVYLWHLFAIQIVILIGGTGPMQALIYTVTLTLLASACSWRYFEKPLMALRRPEWRPWLRSTESELSRSSQTRAS